MEAKALKPYIVVISLLFLTSLVLAFTVDVKDSNEAGVIVELPDYSGEWIGKEMLFCQNPQCHRMYFADQLDEDKCPACGGELGPMTYIEAQVLPADTEITKKRYMNPEGETLNAAIVMSGRERASIHRPELCLSGQGNEIIGDEILTVPFEGRPALDLKILNIDTEVSTRDGRRVTVPRYYAYWFVGKGRETSSNYKRMILMATDRIFHNVSHRWAYISVAGMRDEEGNSHKEKLREFVAELYPQIWIEDS